MVNRKAIIAIASVLVTACLLLSILSLALANPDDWTQVGATGQKVIFEPVINSMAVVGPDLIVGTLNDLINGQIYQLGPTGWFHIGNGETDQQLSISSLIDYNGMVCAGTWGEFISPDDSHGYPGCDVYLQTWADPMKPWNTIASGGFGDPNNRGVCVMCMYNSRLYAGTYNENGCEVWCYDGSNWAQVNIDGFGNSNNNKAQTMALYDSKLFVGTSGAEVWCYDGTSWAQANKDQFSDSDYRSSIDSMAVYGSNLYVGSGGPQSGSNNPEQKPGCRVLSYDGEEWEKVGEGGFGNENNISSSSMVSCESKLFVGTENQLDGCEVWGYDGRRWAKVSTNGFGTGQMKASVMCVKDDQLYVGTQGTMDTGAQVWVKSTGSAPKPPTRTCATGSIGVNEPETEWYIAEGATAGGFETWILVQNPGNTPATVTLTYQTDQGEKEGPTLNLAPKSRESVNVADTIQTYKVSTTVESDKPVVAERSVYYNNRTCATGSIGVNEPETEWYIAEGATAGGFETWILVQNPGNTPATVTLTYQTDQGEKEGPTLNLAPKSRESVNVADTIQTYKVSTTVESDKPVVAERSVYYSE